MLFFAKLPAQRVHQGTRSVPIPVPPGRCRTGTARGGPSAQSNVPRRAWGQVPRRSNHPTHLPPFATRRGLPPLLHPIEQGQG